MEDRDGRPVALFEAEWSLRFAQEKYPDVRFMEMPE
jgi:peptide subunit release factor RF-3